MELDIFVSNQHSRVNCLMTQTNATGRNHLENEMRELCQHVRSLIRTMNTPRINHFCFFFLFLYCAKISIYIIHRKSAYVPLKCFREGSFLQTISCSVMFKGFQKVPVSLRNIPEQREKFNLRRLIEYKSTI